MKMRYQVPGDNTGGKTMLRVTGKLWVEDVPLAGEAKPLPGQEPFIPAEYQVSVGSGSPVLLALKAMA
jgi:hypothetical protein